MRLYIMSHCKHTGSRPIITEVKQRRARLVVGWVTAVKKSWFNLPLTKKPRVVYIRRELTPESIQVLQSIYSISLETIRL
jgi:antitoxin component HigA of HigAB toxin-antitoxin module